MIMTRIFYPVAALLLLPLTAMAQMAGAYPLCDVTVKFVSLCCGIDKATEKKLVKLVETSPLLQPHTARRDYWGREGERNYCLYYKNNVTQEKKDGFVRKIHGFIPKGTATNKAQTWIELPQDTAGNGR